MSGEKQDIIDGYKVKLLAILFDRERKFQILRNAGESEFLDLHLSEVRTIIEIVKKTE